MTTPLILVVGAADTGRAPMAAALLRRTLARHNLAWSAESAGVVGHDGDPAEPEARDAMLAMGLDLSNHTARSLTEELAAQAQLLIAVEAGVARVLRARYPGANITTLGELAGHKRDIPDPFRMQVGAWLHYAGEIDSMINAGFQRLVELVEGKASEGDRQAGEDGAARDRTAPSGVAVSPPLQSSGGDAPGGAQARLAAVERAGRLLSLALELPGVVDWASAARQLTTDLAAMAAPLAADDRSQSYVELLQEILAPRTSLPTPDQLATLRGAVMRLRAPISAADLAQLTVESTAFPTPE